MILKHFFLKSVALSDRHSLPKQPGVYYAVSMMRPTTALYIGMSGNLNKRWNSESNPHHKLWQLRSIPWVRLYYKTTSTRAKAEKLESFEIREYKPLLNGRDERPEQYGFSWKVHRFKRWAIETAIAACIVWGLAFLLLSWLAAK